MTINSGYAGPVGQSSAGYPTLKAHCYDCYLPYGDEYGFPDLIVPDDVWLKISPTGHDGGLLCPNCMCKRCHALGIETSAKFTSGPFTGDRLFVVGGHIAYEGYGKPCGVFSTKEKAEEVRARLQAADELDLVSYDVTQYQLDLELKL